MGKKNDIDKKIKKLSRKTDLKIYKENMGFEEELKKLDNEITSISKNKIKSFETNNELLSNYIDIGSKDDFVERCRRKLDNL